MMLKLQKFGDRKRGIEDEQCATADTAVAYSLE